MSFPIFLTQIFDKLKASEYANKFEVTAQSDKVYRLTFWQSANDSIEMIFQQDTVDTTSIFVGNRVDDQLCEWWSLDDVKTANIIANIERLDGNRSFLKASLPSEVSETVSDLLFTVQNLLVATASNPNLNLNLQLITLEVVSSLVTLKTYYETSTTLQTPGFNLAVHMLNGTTPTPDQVLYGNPIVDDGGTFRFHPVTTEVDVTIPEVQACVGVYEQFVATYTNMVNIGNMLSADDDTTTLDLKLMWSLITENIVKAVDTSRQSD